MKILLSLVIAFFIVSCSAPEPSMTFVPSPSPSPASTPIPEDDIIKDTSIPQASATPIIKKKKKAKKLLPKIVDDSDKSS